MKSKIQGIMIVAVAWAAILLLLTSWYEFKAALLY
jgi:hypothetical protein